MRDLPPEGWSEPDSHGHVTYVHHGSSIGVSPPEKEGFKAFFIARYGSDYTRWSYRPIKERTANHG